MKKENTVDIPHKAPTDLRKALISTPAVKVLWEGLTSLARNEWICWVTSDKKPETRMRRIDQTCNDLIKGKRRPCCWPGCPHRQAKKGV